jgi:membrane fusion protein, copper/silver efflux system
MKKLRFLSNKYIKSSLLIIAGILLGWVFFHHSGRVGKMDQATMQEQSKAEKTIWTCAMHPQIRMDKPGKCPICGMDLIPLQKLNPEVDENAIQMSESARKLADVQTSIVVKGPASRTVSLYGKIKPDETLLQSQTAHVPGRIEQLFINVTGETIKKGQLIARIYSPELVSAQKELLEAESMAEKYPAVLTAAKEKLHNLKLSDQQISDIEKAGKVTSTFDITANTSGVVTSLQVNQGDYINTGTILFDVADLRKVWAVFDAYESDLPWISSGQKVEFTTQAVPGRNFEGDVFFIDPVINPSTRIAAVRAKIDNSDLQLKPDMFINGVVMSNINGSTQYLTIPQSAVLWTGKRSLVYVKIPGSEIPAFKMRQITLGADTKDGYIVQDGLKEGEEIVTNGTFSVDAAAQLAGRPSMMDPKGGGNAPSIMPGMNMDMAGMKTTAVGTEKRDTTNSAVNKPVNTDFINELTAVFNAYLPMKNDFVQSDSGKIKEAAESILEKLKQVNRELLKGQAMTEWMAYEDPLNTALDKIIVAHDIEVQRQGFADFNLAFYKVLKRFGLSGDTVYYQYCPMAFGNRGAYWFSEKKDIENPYFGDKMMKCGETREILKY